MGKGAQECFLVLRYGLVLKYVIIIKRFSLEKYLIWGSYTCGVTSGCKYFELSKQLLVTLARFLFYVKFLILVAGSSGSIPTHVTFVS